MKPKKLKQMNLILSKFKWKIKIKKMIIKLVKIKNNLKKKIPD